MTSTPPDRRLNPDDTPGPEDLLIRPSTSSDVEDFYELARLAGAGFTSLPVNEGLLGERLSESERAFAGEPGVLTLALEDLRSARVVGCAAIKPGDKPRPDFLNFGIEDDGLALSPTARYADMTEVGSLLLHPDYRCAGIGPWLARSRYLLIAADLDRFGAAIFSELRGMVDEDDRSPFYDAVCAPHFGCSFAEADDLCAHGRQAELNEKLPAEPIPLHSLGTPALDAMGRPHRAGRRALDYLEAEGFRFDGVVDLLDGGPVVVSASRSVKTIRNARETVITPGIVEDEDATDAYIAIGTGPDYRCHRSRVTFADGAVICPSQVVAGLGGSVSGRVMLLDEGGCGLDHRRPQTTASKDLTSVDGSAH